MITCLFLIVCVTEPFFVFCGEDIYGFSKKKNLYTSGAFSPGPPPTNAFDEAYKV